MLKKTKLKVIVLYTSWKYLIHKSYRKYAAFMIRSKPMLYKICYTKYKSPVMFCNYRKLLKN